MTIHVVQPGETINSISDLYNIPVDRLILENGIMNPDDLVIGQTIVIVPPELVYTVQDGDTLESIAEQNGITLMELLRNNPYLSDREYIYPGETLVIRYQTVKSRAIATSGYTFHYIDRNILRKTLPFLSYLTIFNYSVTSEGEIISEEDEVIIQMAKEFGVAPMMFVSTYTPQGKSIPEAVFNFLRNPEALDRLIDNVLRLLSSKGFYGVNFYIEHINLENMDQIIANVSYIASRLHSEGYRVLATITPEFIIKEQMITFEPLDYNTLEKSLDAIVFTSYEWGTSYSYPSSFAPVNLISELLNYVDGMIPPEKIFIGLITLGYDWELPYVPGASGANAVTTESAIQIAAEHGAVIQFNEAAQAPYFYYTDEEEDLHLIWFKDARSFDAIAGLVLEYGLQGLSIWTIMNFNAQMWFIINTEYEIEKILNIPGQ